MLGGKSLSLAGRLAGVTLELRPGEVTAICGPNGAGKSSLLACLGGIVGPDAGQVELDGVGLCAMPARQRACALGYLPQDGAAAWDMSVETLAGLGRLPWRTGAAQDAAAVDAALAALELDRLRHRSLSRLSGGERARAMLARVLAGAPRWLLADEPLANLDLAHQQALLVRFRDLARQGIGVVLVLHDLAQAANHADRVVVLENGRIAADGPPDQALAPELVEKVWGIGVRWLGEPGSRALAFGPAA